MDNENARKPLRAEVDASYATLCGWYQKQAMMAWYVALILLLLFFITNLMWWSLWNDYDHTYIETTYTEYTVEQDSDGTNIITNCFNEDKAKE